MEKAQLLQPLLVGNCLNAFCLKCFRRVAIYSNLSLYFPRCPPLFLFGNSSPFSYNNTTFMAGLDLVMR